MINKSLLPIILIILLLFSLVGCNAFSNNSPTPDPDVTVEVDETAEADETPEVDETAEANETPEVDETVEADETPEVDETAEANETPEVDETAEVDETPEVDIDNPFPSNGGGYYVAPSYATREDNVNVVDVPDGYYWVVATVTLGNEAGESTTIDIEDIYLIGNDGLRYETYEMVERVSPTLVNTELAEGSSVYGFALFALPADVEPSLFEWCPSNSCDTPLQAQISLQNE